MTTDYSRLGLRVGIEIHQQLATRNKLFCGCRAELAANPPTFSFYRRLRPTQSELGAVDPAAAFEFKRGRGFEYEVDNQTSCLVEMDEEPPHEINEDAVDVCLTVALMTQAKPVDEVHVMRKIVIDGSNTTGFQRTCVIALGGEVIVDGKPVGIQTISLEEDAARKTVEKGSVTHYRLDRLCVPLIEVATAPDIHSPEAAEKVALALGQVLRATRRVRRGIGTIRQDLNVSITGGALTEVKGVQELDLVAPVVEMEVQRQLGLQTVASDIAERGVTEASLRDEYVNVSEALKATKCKVVKSALERGGVALALKLDGFFGLLGRELIPGLRLGTELSDYAKFYGRVGGIFHTDELPAYGITEEEVKELRALTGATETDGVVLVADEAQAATDALNAVLARAREATRSVPSETRAAQPDGTTRFSRPRPGAARMYPETDVPPVVIDPDRLRLIKQRQPPSPSSRLKQLLEDYRLNERLASDILYSEYLDLFEKTARETTISPSFLAATLVETLKSLRRQGLEVQRIAEATLFEVFRAIGSGTVGKEAMPDILSWLAKNPSKTFDDAFRQLRLGAVSHEELETTVTRVVDENIGLVQERGIGALGPLMGTLMRELRGKADAKTLSDLLRKRIELVSRG
jgi:glutamyl-tRNA(Gln) amidotransferase subunit E